MNLARVVCYIIGIVVHMVIHCVYVAELDHLDRSFLTLFGYPQRCHTDGTTYPCTFTLACWWSGGSTYPGCESSMWIISCCITKRKLRNGVSQELVNMQIQPHHTSVVDVVTSKYRIHKRQYKPNCGLRADRTFSKRIIGGKEASFGQFPWQAFIKIGAYQCGGVLVAQNIVATAAHCVHHADLTNITVILGELDTMDTGQVREWAPTQVLTVRGAQPDRFDVALLQLADSADISTYVQPICLPSKGVALDGRIGIVAGWGKVHAIKGHLEGTHILRSAFVPILDKADCVRWHRISRLSVDLHDEMLCAGHESGQQDSCLGDSGGPLIIRQKSRWTLVGITSAGFGCGQPFQPGIYHRVSSSVGWIENQIKMLSEKMM